MPFAPQLATSRKYVPVIVSSKVAGEWIDPTTDTVEFAFTLHGADPEEADFVSGIWETDSTTNPPTYTALCNVGPGGDIELAEGSWSVWLRITDNPEVPIELVSGLFVIF